METLVSLKGGALFALWVKQNASDFAYLTPMIIGILENLSNFP